MGNLIVGKGLPTYEVAGYGSSEAYRAIYGIGVTLQDAPRASRPTVVVVVLDRVELTGFRPPVLPHHRTCGFPHTAVESGGLRCCTRELPRKK